MNIFALDRDPVIAAQMMCDKHIVKMITESFQMFSAVIDPDRKSFFLNGMPGFPKSVTKHPCTIWTRSSKGNYMWHYKHVAAMCDEYTKRYDKVHKFHKMLDYVLQSVESIAWDKVELEDFTLAIQDTRWHRSDTVESYRTYYNMEKFLFAKWKNGNIPTWFVGAPLYNVILDIT